MFPDGFPKLTSQVTQVLLSLNFKKLTDVQVRCIPEFLAHKDVVVQSPTGSGKTIAYVVPVLEMLLRRQPSWTKWEVGAVVLIPTRELLLQVAEVFEQFLQGSFLKLICFSSGKTAMSHWNRFKEKGGNIILATPGLMEQMHDSHGEFNMRGHLRNLEVLILDEADRLLELGFHSSLITIMGALPKQRRTGLFSATLPDATENIIKAGLRNPVMIRVSSQPSCDFELLPNCSESPSDSIIPSTLQNFYAVVSAEAKLAALATFLTLHKTEKTVVFFSTCVSVSYLGSFLKTRLRQDEPELNVTLLHRKMSVRNRQKYFSQFQSPCSNCVLLCTDLMARGIDFESVDWVVQFDVPRNVSGFAHRIGRTARSGKSGKSLILLMKSEKNYVRFLRRNQKIRLERLKLPTSKKDSRSLTESLRALALCDRAVLENGTRAFVSYIQHYSKQDCHIVCPLKELDVAGIATCFGLLRLPQMPELRGRDTSKFDAPKVKTVDIPYLDTKREALRQQRLKERKEQQTCTYDQKKKASLNRNGRKRSKGRVKAHEFDDFELNEIDDDYRLLKKLKKGKISKEQFENEFLGD